MARKTHQNTEYTRPEALPNVTQETQAQKNKITPQRTLSHTSHLSLLMCRSEEHERQAGKSERATEGMWERQVKEHIGPRCCRGHVHEIKPMDDRFKQCWGSALSPSKQLSPFLTAAHHPSALLESVQG